MRRLAAAALLTCLQAQGSGLPPLIAYLNGCKLRNFSSSAVIVAKFVATVCTIGAGIFAEAVKSVQGVPDPCSDALHACRRDGAKSGILALGLQQIQSDRARSRSLRLGGGRRAFAVHPTV
eukprot:4066428-Pleurochrysis_carterae.AAC.1